MFWHCLFYDGGAYGRELQICLQNVAFLPSRASFFTFLTNYGTI